MNQNELRIGNFVSAKTTSETFNIVCEIGDGGSGRGWYVRLENVNHGVWLEHNDNFLIEGIEITEKWLIKLGFTCDWSKIYTKRIEENSFELRFDKTDKIIVLDVNINYEETSLEFKHIKYIHQLQNLYFALVNSELQLLKADL